MFAPGDGGQAEILGHPDLLFSNTDEAVEKIIAALEKPSLQSALRTHLTRRAKLFSTQSFVHEVQTFIADVLTADQTSSCKAASQTL